MAELPSDKQPKPVQTLDPQTVERTVKFLWTNRRINKFKVRANQKKIKALETELKEAKTQVRAFSMRLDREFDKHPEVFKKMGLSNSDDNSED